MEDKLKRLEEIEKEIIGEYTKMLDNIKEGMRLYRKLVAMLAGTGRDIEGFIEKIREGEITNTPEAEAAREILEIETRILNHYDKLINLGTEYAMICDDIIKGKDEYRAIYENIPREKDG